MSVVFFFKVGVLRLIFGHATQNGTSLEEKQSFYDDQNNKWGIHGVNDLIVCIGDFIGYMGRYIDGLDGVYQVRGIWMEEC